MLFIYPNLLGGVQVWVNSLNLACIFKASGYKINVGTNCHNMVKRVFGVMYIQGSREAIHHYVSLLQRKQIVLLR